jgi:hypothetical protein
MMGFLVIATFAGMLLGIRCKVLFLVLAILFAICGVAVCGIVSERGLKVIALTGFETVALLQIGYIAGCFLETVALARFLPQVTVQRAPTRGGLDGLFKPRFF